MLATSKNVLFSGHNQLLATSENWKLNVNVHVYSADDPSL